MVPEIHHSILIGAFVPHPQPQHSPVLFDAIKALYFAEIHSLIMESWKNFRETLNETAERKKEDYQELTLREESLKASERQSEKRHIEVYNETFEAKKLASKFKIYEGDQHMDGRHLHFPV